MKATIIFLLILFSFSSRLNAQIHAISGRVVAEDDLDVMPGVRIQTRDKTILGTTGMDGRFKIDLAKNTHTLLFNFIGYEPAIIKLNSDCDTIEVIMLVMSTYDFMSSKIIDKDRLARFNKLPELHLQVYKKGLFMKESVCYTREFESWKLRLDSIHKGIIRKEKQIKLAFEKLAIGDTIKIPFSAPPKANETDTTRFGVYSAYSNFNNYDCIIKCVIVDKNKQKKGYNLACKMIDCDRCKYPGVFNGRIMKSGEVFKYNMRYFKILHEKYEQ